MIDLSVLRDRIDDLEKTVSAKEQETRNMKGRIAALEIWIPGRRTPEKSSAVDTVQKTLKVALGKIHERTLTFDARFDDATEVVTWVFMDQVGRLEKEKSEQILLNGRLLIRIQDLKSKIDGFLEQAGRERQTDSLSEDEPR